MPPKVLMCLGGRQRGTLNASTRNPLEAITIINITAISVAHWETSLAGGIIQEPAHCFGR